MTHQEFLELVSDLLADVPGDLAVMRLAALVWALVECGGDPAADLVRAVALLREHRGGDYSEIPPAALVCELAKL